MSQHWGYQRRGDRTTLTGPSSHLYPRGSHDWPGRQGALGIAHAAAFLSRHL